MFFKSSKVLLDGIQETDQVWISRQKLMTWSQRLKPKKQEVANSHLSGGRLVLVDANDDMAGLKYFFCIFQQSDKGLFGATVCHLSSLDQDVKPPFPQDRVPTCVVLGTLGVRNHAWKTAAPDAKT